VRNGIELVVHRRSALPSVAIVHSESKQ
jgi:hypothetical protein